MLHSRWTVADDTFSTSAVSDRKSTRLNSSHRTISYAVFCLKKKYIATDGSLASRFVLACLNSSLHVVEYPRFPPSDVSILAVISYLVHPFNIPNSRPIIEGV